jgi:hypothetical protein
MISPIKGSSDSSRDQDIPCITSFIVTVIKLRTAKPPLRRLAVPVIFRFAIRLKNGSKARSGYQ